MCNILVVISLFTGTLDLMNMFIITYPSNGNAFIIFILVCYVDNCDKEFPPWELIKYY